MSAENEKRNNVRRLAYCLFQRSEDPAFISRLASLLHYMPDQLQRDICDMETYTAEKVNADRENE